MKIVFTFYKKPKNNFYTFNLEGWENFDFFYQPELTQEEIDEGHIRPDNVVGSYAVYHKTKRNHEMGKTDYKTGKFCHIYRPCAVDNNADFAWTELKIDNGVYTVTIPQDFIDKAEYPVIINDEFGYHANGGSVDTQSANQLSAQVYYSAAGAGDVTTISCYCGFSQFTNGQCAVYHRVAAVPDTYKGESEQKQNWNGPATTSLCDFTVSPTFEIAADDYAICLWSGTEYWFDYDAGTNYGIDNTGNTYNTWPKPWAGTNRARNYNYCIWVTYTPSAGGGAKPAASQILILE
jgi:hypothetical protein